MRAAEDMRQELTIKSEKIKKNFFDNLKVKTRKKKKTDDDLEVEDNREQKWKRLEDNPELKTTNVKSNNLQQELQDAPIEAANKIKTKTKINCKNLKVEYLRKVTAKKLYMGYTSNFPPPKVVFNYDYDWSLVWS